MEWLCYLEEIFLHSKLCSYLILHFLFVYFITPIGLQVNIVHEYFLPGSYNKILHIEDSQQKRKS